MTDSDRTRELVLLVSRIGGYAEPWREHGYRVLQVESALEAIDWLDQASIDDQLRWIVIDQVLPDIDGGLLVTVLNGRMATQTWTPRPMLVFVSSTFAEFGGEVVPADTTVCRVSAEAFPPIVAQLVESRGNRPPRTICPEAIRPSEATRHFVHQYRRLSAVADDLFGGMIVVEPGGRIVEANNSIVQIVGRPVYEIIGMRPGDLFSTEDQGALASARDGDTGFCSTGDNRHFVEYRAIGSPEEPGRLVLHFRLADTDLDADFQFDRREQEREFWIAAFRRACGVGPDEPADADEIRAAIFGMLAEHFPHVTLRTDDGTVDGLLTNISYAFRRLGTEEAEGS